MCEPCGVLNHGRPDRFRLHVAAMTLLQPKTNPKILSPSMVSNCGGRISGLCDRVFRIMGPFSLRRLLELLSWTEKPQA